MSLSRKPIDGAWSGWTQYSPLNATHVTRTRPCDAPPAMFGGQDCSGASQEITIPVEEDGIYGGNMDSSNTIPVI